MSGGGPDRPRRCTVHTFRLLVRAPVTGFQQGGIRMTLPSPDGSAGGDVRRGLAADVIVANAPDPVFVSDLRGKILEANEAVSHLLGLRPDEVIEQSLSRIISAEETREFIAALREVVERGVTRNVRLNPRSASGEVIPTTLNASALRDVGGTVIGAIGILRDMREYERVLRDLQESRRELREADRAKDQFLAIVSHELRPPPTAMLGWARPLRTGIPDRAGAAGGL